MELFSIKLDASGEDRKAVAHLLRVVAGMIDAHNSPQWHTSDSYGSLRAIQLTNGAEPPTPVLTPAEIIDDPSASTWLRSALRLALARDPIDAANDAEVLAGVLVAAADATLTKARQRGGEPL
jgi:hypothetical protein